MIRLIGEHWEDDVRVRWYGDDVLKTITIERWQDPTRAINQVAAINAEGGIKADGTGHGLGEIPLVLGIEWATKRGIPWEKMLYGDEYNAEYKMFLAEHSKLAYKNAKSVHAVA